MPARYVGGWNEVRTKFLLSKLFLIELFLQLAAVTKAKFGKVNWIVHEFETVIKTKFDPRVTAWMLTLSIDLKKV